MPVACSGFARASVSITARVLAIRLHASASACLLAPESLTCKPRHFEPTLHPLIPCRLCGDCCRSYTDSLGVSAKVWERPFLRQFLAAVAKDFEVSVSISPPKAHAQHLGHGPSSCVCAHAAVLIITPYAVCTRAGMPPSYPRPPHSTSHARIRVHTVAQSHTRIHAQVVLFTAAGARHADSVLERLDPQCTIFVARLYGQHCCECPQVSCAAPMQVSHQLHSAIPGTAPALHPLPSPTHLLLP